MTRLTVILICMLTTLCGCSPPADAQSEWRGPSREGIYYEKGLLDRWPDEGPDLIWSYEGLGQGHSSAAVGNGRVYINGMPDTLGVLYCFDLDGKLLWQKVYGEEWHVNYTGTRSTPVLAEQLLYLISGTGVLFCFDAVTGNIRWQVDVLDRFDAENITWGITENLLIDGDHLICTPGGKQHNVVALNRFTGETVWTTPGFGELSAYCSPIMVRHNQSRLIVTMTANSVIGLDAETGEMYWRAEQMQVNKIHANPPVYSDGVIYCSSASAPASSGLLALRLSDNGRKVQQLWRNESFQNLMGGIIVKDGVIFGSAYRKNEWYAIDPADGSKTLLTKDFGGGVITYADGLFYLYSEAGEVALAAMDKDSFEFRGRFRVPLGTDQHWAHPVIHNRRMYIRHGDALMVYDVSAGH